MSNETTLGPVEIAVIGFPGNRFTGEIAPALVDLVDRGIVTILDLLFVAEDAAGDVVAVELSEVDDDVAAPYLAIDGEAGGLLGDDDVEQIGAALDAESSALAVVWENTWAREFVNAMRDSGGVLVAHDRIDSATVSSVLAAIDS